MKRVLVLLVMGTIFSGMAAYVATAKTNPVGTPAIPNKR
ncbi:hypothetical protein ACVWYO_003681 [Sphingomonas sp. UYP23]